MFLAGDFSIHHRGLYSGFVRRPGRLARMLSPGIAAVSIRRRQSVHWAFASYPSGHYQARIVLTIPDTMHSILFALTKPDGRQQVQELWQIAISRISEK